jgi:hypothetical protein
MTATSGRRMVMDHVLTDCGKKQGSKHTKKKIDGHAVDLNIQTGLKKQVRVDIRSTHNNRRLNGILGTNSGTELFTVADRILQCLLTTMQSKKEGFVHSDRVALVETALHQMITFRQFIFVGDDCDDAINLHTKNILHCLILQTNQIYYIMEKQIH